jgi:hypothetical protein
VLASKILCESYSVTVGNHKSINKRNKITKEEEKRKNRQFDYKNPTSLL